MNSDGFFGFGAFDRERLPKTLYAKVDQIETPLAGEEFGTALLDCIDAAAFDEKWRGAVFSRIEGDEPDRDISVVVTNSNRFFQEYQRIDAEWFRLDLSEPADAGEVEHFLTLFGAPVARDILAIEDIPPEIGDELRRTMGWAGIEPCEDAAIRKMLAGIPRINSAAIYDVGQDSAVALLHGTGAVAYFDLGGSVLVNRRSFPQMDVQFCFKKDPIVILSHWDWDHWSSAMRDTNALSRRWVVPIQSQAGSLGAVHARFVAALRRLGNEPVWVDYGSRPIEIGAGDWKLTLDRCAADNRDRNLSGLMALVSYKGRRLALPGDGPLDQMPSLKFDRRTGKSLSCDFIAVSHHGGRAREAHLPDPERVTRSALVYSYGAGNSFLHPLEDTIRRWRASAWRKTRHTAVRGADGLGHIGVDLDRSRPESAPGYGRVSHCAESVREWLR